MENTVQDRGRSAQAGQQLRGDRVELADVTEGEHPRERAQRRGRPGLGEQPAHPAVAQQVHVLDAVGAGDHASDQREDLSGGVRSSTGGDAQPIGQQRRQLAPGGQRHDRDKPGTRHKIRIIEPHRDRAASVRQ